MNHLRSDPRLPRSSGLLVDATLLALIGFGLATPPAFGTEPSFDCAQAEGMVEELICEDAELATLDRDLAEAYRLALKRFKEQGYEDPRPFQRGWVKGRDDCWKAKDVRQCVATGYKQRIAELQIACDFFFDVSPTVDYSCGDFDLATVFYRETDPPTVVLTPMGPHKGADQMIAYLSPSASGAQYEGASVSFWEHHGEARLTWFGKEMTCNVR